MILLTNDDGINAPGLAAALEGLTGLDEVVVVAPDMEQSGAAHSISIHTPLRVRRVSHGRHEFHAVNGSPADCVKLAVYELIRRRPDAVVSGINYGSNIGVDILYSGTVAGALEGAMLGVPSFAFSLDFREQLDFTAASSVVRDVYNYFIRRPLPPGTLLNVNIPALPADQIRGVMITRMSKAGYAERYEKRLDPRGNAYYWITGSIEEADRTPGTDIRALEEGYVTVTPLHYDLTEYRAAEELGGLGSMLKNIGKE